MNNVTQLGYAALLPSWMPDILALDRPVVACSWALAAAATAGMAVAAIVLKAYVNKLRRQIAVERSEHERNIRHLAYYDASSELPNRLSLQEELAQVLSRANLKQAVLMYIDTDHFKYINDTMGHSFGDRLMREVSGRLKLLIPPEGSIFRIGGDEFVILLESTVEQPTWSSLPERIVRGFHLPFIIGEHKMFLSISMGVVFYPEHGNTPDEMMISAELAMYRSKEAGRASYTLYHPSMRQALSDRMNLEKHLRGGLDHDEFQVYYQPQILAETGRITGFEALIRWMSPELGTVPPAEFIKVAEDSRMIISIGEWVLLTACAFLKELHDHHPSHSELMISVNISVIQLQQDDFEGTVFGILEEVGLKPSFLELEITESVFLEATDCLTDKLQRLKEAGIRIALDDFGTGYSSLSYLQRLPISTLKVDKAFIDQFTESGKGRALAESIILMGQGLGLEVVAEGVEKPEQYALLRERHCDRLQGYLFSKPIPGKEATAMLASQY